MIAITNELDAIFDSRQFLHKIRNIREPLHILKDEIQLRIGLLTHTEYQSYVDRLASYSVSHLGVLPTIYPEWLGDPSFLATYHVRFPYIVGEMANGIATSDMVIAAAKAGMLGFFGAAGLMPEEITQNIHKIKMQLADRYKNWGSNLIHSPQEPHLEQATVDLYLQHGVRIISASAYMALNPEVVRYAVSGLFVDQQGNIQRQNRILAKISRPEVAKQFLSPAPPDMLEHLVTSGKITSTEAQLAQYIPIAEDITVEADSGGHTDNRPLTVLFPSILSLAEEIRNHYQYPTSFRIGAAGGLGTPAAVAAAFSMQAAYVLTGSINQATIESGLCMEAKKMLAQAELADVAMAAAADMFELGVKLQVLKRGSLFSVRANKLYELYIRYNSLEDIPDYEKNKLEKNILRAPLRDIWEEVRNFFNIRDPIQLQLAEKDPKHRMALVFRWYLGLSSRWAIMGYSERRSDYQIWCGPAMGGFNQWVKGSFLENVEARTIIQIGKNLLEGAAIITRVQPLRSAGVAIPSTEKIYRPVPFVA